MPQVNTANRGEIYFLVMAVVLLIINIAGFSLMAMRFSDQFPASYFWLQLHAVTSFAWLLLLVAQTGLIRGGNISLHRTLGKWSGLIALGLVISGAMVALNAAQRSGNVENASFQVVSLINFSVLVGLGLTFRKQAAQHKRLMILATIAIAAPAVFRLAVSLSLPEPLIPMTLLMLILSVVIYDLFQTRRVKWATATGAALILGGIAVSLFLNSTDWWPRFLTATLA